MHEVEGEVSVTVVRMVYLVPVRDLCKERARVGGEWVECKAVDGNE